MKKHMLLLSMTVITLLAVGAVLTTLHVFRAQESAMDSMMRSYVLDLADSVSDTIQSTGRHGMGRGRMTHYRMLSMSPTLPNGDMGGVLILTEDGRIPAASAGAERLMPLWREGVSVDEPQVVQDAGGNQFYIAAKNAGNGLLVLAAVSRTHLLGPILDVRRLWMSLAALTSLGVLAGMLGLWRYLVSPLHRVVEGVRNMKWGRDQPLMQTHTGFHEIKALSNAISELAGEAIAREELRVRYVSDIVRVQEELRKRLARDLHDSSLQDLVAAIKQIQLARGSIGGSLDVLAENLKLAEEITQNAAMEIRSICDELSPSWVKLGLSAAMFENTDRVSRAFGVEVEVRGAEEVESSLEVSEEYILAFVRILQEAVSNSMRHGGASRVEVSLRKEKEAGVDYLCLCVRDDGKGFAAQPEMDYERLRAAGHRGLAHIHERVQLLKGQMTLKSEPENGCLIDIVVPC